MNTSTNTAKEYAVLVRNNLGARVKKIILFGSQARGEASPGSDYDFVVVVDNRTREIREKIIDVGIEMMDRHDQLFAALVYSEDEWRKTQQFPLGWNVNAEGIAL